MLKLQTILFPIMTAALFLLGSFYVSSYAVDWKMDEVNKILILGKEAVEAEIKTRTWQISRLIPQLVKDPDLGANLKTSASLKFNKKNKKVLKAHENLVERIKQINKQINSDIVGIVDSKGNPFVLSGEYISEADLVNKNEDDKSSLFNVRKQGAFLFKNHIYAVAIEPMKVRDKFIGAIIAGMLLEERFADVLKTRTGLEIGFFPSNGPVISGFNKNLNGLIQANLKKKKPFLLSDTKSGSIWGSKVGGTHLCISGLLTGIERPLKYALILDIEQIMKPVKQMQWPLYILGIGLSFFFLFWSLVLILVDRKGYKALIALIESVLSGGNILRPAGTSTGWLNTLTESTLKLLNSYIDNKNELAQIKYEMSLTEKEFSKFRKNNVNAIPSFTPQIVDEEDHNSLNPDAKKNESDEQWVEYSSKSSRMMTKKFNITQLNEIDSDHEAETIIRDVTLDELDQQEEQIIRNEVNNLEHQNMMGKEQANNQIKYDNTNENGAWQNSSDNELLSFQDVGDFSNKNGNSVSFDNDYKYENVENELAEFGNISDLDSNSDFDSNNNKEITKVVEDENSELEEVIIDEELNQTILGDSLEAADKTRSSDLQNPDEESFEIPKWINIMESETSSSKDLDINQKGLYSGVYEVMQTMAEGTDDDITQEIGSDEFGIILEKVESLIINKENIDLVRFSVGFCKGNVVVNAIPVKLV